jgi:hypothetical protein
MKKLFSIILILAALLQISLTSAFATANVSFEMQNADMKPNRLFSVALSANSGNRLSAATFEFTYDADYIEFRKVKAVNNGSKIQVNKKSGKVKVVFLNSEGQNISGGSDVLTLDFKTIKEGTAYIDYTVNQCVDSDVNFMDVGSCTASCIRIYKNASGTVSGGSSSSSNKNSTQATGNGGKSKHPTEPTTVNASDDEYIDYNPIKDKQIKFFLAGMGITAGCLAISVKKQLRRKLKKRKITMTILLKTRLPMIDSEVFYFAFLPCVISRFANSRLIEFKTRFLSALHIGATSSFLSPSPVKR